jgi:tRNA(Ile)-lysidine synthase
MKKLDEKIIHFVEEHQLIKKGEKILVALSGGPDSIFMLNFLLKFKKKYGIEVGAMHINHMIRGKEADDDEKFCRQLCERLSVQYHAVKKNVPAYAKKNKISIEEAARKVRYDELENVRKKSGYDKIATAHNCSDNAETMFLNLVKGTGLKGLSGIPISRGEIIRPILPITKDEILKSLTKNKIGYLIDKSNLSNVYERNFLRNDIFPLLKKQLNPKLEETMFKSSLVLRKQAEVQNSVVEIAAKLVSRSTRNKLEINCTLLKEVTNELWSDVIKLSADRTFLVQTTFNDCQKVMSLVEKQIGKSVSISNNLVAVRERNSILIFPKPASQRTVFAKLKVGESVQAGDKNLKIEKIGKHEFEYSPNKNIELIAGDELSDEFVLRTWRNGDRFYPLGLKGSKKVSDFLNDCKVAVSQKSNQLVLTNNNKIIWVVGHRIDDRFKIKNITRKVLRLCLN